MGVPAILSRIRARHAAPFLLAGLFLLIYFPVLRRAYLLNDEAFWAGSRLDPFERAWLTFREQGRYLLGLTHTLVFRFAGFDPLRVAAVRASNLMLLALLGIILYRFLRRERAGVFAAFCTVLFFLSHRSVQGLAVYGLVTVNFLFPAALSLAAFYLHFYVLPSRSNGVVAAPAVTFLILSAAAQWHQAIAFFAMAPLACIMLARGHDRFVRRLAAGFLAAAFAAMLTNFLIFAVQAAVLPGGTHAVYGRGASLFSVLKENPAGLALRAFNPAAYWGAFQTGIGDMLISAAGLRSGSAKTGAAFVVMALWFLLLVFSTKAVWRAGKPEERGAVFFSRLFVLACAAFGGFFLLADSPKRIIEHRPHILLVLSAVWIFSASFSLQVLAMQASPRVRALLRAAAAVVVAAAALNAHANAADTARLHGDVHDYVRSSIGRAESRDLALLIIIRSRGVPVCRSEPCGPWFGRMPGPVRQAYEARYRFALETSGINPRGVEIVFTKTRPQTVPDGTGVVDWAWYAKHCFAGRDGSRAGCEKGRGI